MASNRQLMTYLVVAVFFGLAFFVAKDMGWLGGTTANQVAPSGTGNANAPGGSVNVPVCNLAAAQTLGLGVYDADKPGTGVGGGFNYVFLDPNAGALNPGNLTTQVGTTYTVFSGKTDYFGAIKSITTTCTVSPTLTVYLKAVDTAVTASIINSDGLTANSATNQSIASGGSAVVQLRLQQSSAYKHLAGEKGTFTVFLNDSDGATWDASQMTMTFDNKQCTQYTGTNPSSAITGVIVKAFTCTGDFAPNDGAQHIAYIKYVALNGVDPVGTVGRYVAFVGDDYYQNTVTGVIANGPVKDSGAAIQTAQSVQFKVS